MLYSRSLKIVQPDIIFVLLLYGLFQYGWFKYSYLNTVQSPLGYVSCFKICLLKSCLWYEGFITSDPPFEIQFYLVPPILFSIRAYALFYLGNHTPLFMEWHYVSHWRLHDNRRMSTFANVSQSKFSHFFVFKYWSLLKPVIGDVDDNLQFPVPSMNRLNRTEPATFKILTSWTFYWDSVFFIYKRLQLLFKSILIKPAFKQ
jgi:hypothetical protein